MKCKPEFYIEFSRLPSYPLFIGVRKWSVSEMEQKKEQAEKTDFLDRHWNDDMLQDEIFGLLHRAIAYINEGREADEQIEVFDRELGYAATMLIERTAIREVLNRRILDDYNADLERYADLSGGEE